VSWPKIPPSVEVAAGLLIGLLWAALFGIYLIHH